MLESKEATDVLMMHGPVPQTTGTTINILLMSPFYIHRLRYKGYFGGVTAMSAQQFRDVNGFSNIFWGWGGEDDELRQR